MGEYSEAQRRIGQTIKVYARERQVTLKSIYDALGMSKGSFFERLRGEAKMSIEELIDIANLLDVGVADLFAPPAVPARSSADTKIINRRTAARSTHIAHAA